MAEEPEGFGARWSRRKRLSQVHEAAQRQDRAPDTATQEAREAREAQEAREAARLEEENANRLAAEAVDLDALRYGDDFSVFLKRGVPQLLRRRALRKFFGSDPVLANLDGLNDYDEDFNAPAHRVYNSAWDAVKGYAGKARVATNEPRSEPTDRAGDLAGDAPAPPGPAPGKTESAAADPAADPAACAARSGGADGAHPATASSSAAAAEAGCGPARDPSSGPASRAAPAPQEAPRRVSLRHRLEV